MCQFAWCRLAPCTWQQNCVGPRWDWIFPVLLFTGHPSFTQHLSICTEWTLERPPAFGSESFWNFCQTSAFISAILQQSQTCLGCFSLCCCSKHQRLQGLHKLQCSVNMLLWWTWEKYWNKKHFLLHFKDNPSLPLWLSHPQSTQHSLYPGMCYKSLLKVSATSLQILILSEVFGFYWSGDYILFVDPYLRR